MLRLHGIALLLAAGSAGCDGGALQDGGSTDEICDDGSDNDGNGYRDCADPACKDDPACTGDGGSSGWAEVVVNEFMASNASSVQDETGAFPDWFELFNAGDEAVSLDGWTVTDDLEEPDKHTLGELDIQAGGFLLLFADEDLDQGERHVDFALDMAGEEIGLFAPDGTSVDLLEYEPQQTDISAARVPDGSQNWELTSQPTPGESNGG